MRSLSFQRGIFLILAFTTFAGFALGQYQDRALERARSVKLLTDDRETVRKIFSDLNLDYSNDISDRFSFGETEIEVTYSSGECDEDEDEIWDAPAGRAVQIEISDSSGLTSDLLKFDLTTLEREQIFFGRDEFFILHSKANGFAVEVDEENGEKELKSLILFPSAGLKAKPCKTKFAKEFVELKSWFGSRKLKDRQVCDFNNRHANVTDLALSHREISATVKAQVEITTTAVDPENDILTYSYTVTGGRIVGSGAKVIWDMTGVRQGSYSITVGVDDGAGVVGETRSAVVTVK